MIAKFGAKIHHMLCADSGIEVCFCLFSNSIFYTLSYFTSSLRVFRDTVT